MNIKDWIPFVKNENHETNLKNVRFQLVFQPYALNTETSSNVFRSFITNKYVKSLRDTGCMIIMIEATATGSPNGIFILSRNVKSEKGTVVALCPAQNDLQVHWNPYEHPSIEIIPNDSTKPIVYNVRVIQP